jgi:hypothetical protein
MKFMLLMSGNVKGFEALGTWSPDDFRAHVAFMHRFIRTLTEAGEFVAAEGLDMPSKAKIVKSSPTGGDPIVTDGPFPETKEFLAGYWIVEVENEARAIALAAYASTAPGKNGVQINIPIEVRQIMSGPPTEE